MRALLEIASLNMTLAHQKNRKQSSSLSLNNFFCSFVTAEVRETKSQNFEYVRLYSCRENDSNESPID